MVTTSFSGADVEALRDMAAQCAAGAQQLAAVGARTTLTLNTNLTWKGADAERLRSQWQDEALPAIDTVAGNLREAGLQLVREAEQQLTASTDGATTTTGAGTASPTAAATSAGNKSAAAGATSTGDAAPGSTPTGSTPSTGSANDGGAASATSTPAASATSTPAASSSGASESSGTNLKDQLGKLRDVLTGLPAQGMLGRILAELPHDAHWGDVPNAVAKVGAEATPFEKFGTGALGAYATVANANGLVTSLENDDAGGVLSHGIPLVFTALGPEVDATLGTAWSAGYAVGTVAYDNMQGTRYGDIVQSMTDDAFHEHGALGMLQVPGILGFAAWEYFTEDR